LLTALAGAAKGQYGEVPAPPPTCELNWDCVHTSICHNGVIDTSGGGSFDLRTGVPVVCSAADHVCCQVPVSDDYAPQPPNDNLLCSAYEDCVQPSYCHDGVISTDGAGHIDLRIKKTDYRKCYNQEYQEDGICCRIPDSPPVANSCADGAICTDLSYCDANGVISSSIQQGVYTAGQDCFTNPGLSWNVGVCCAPASPRHEECLGGTVCTPSEHCDASGSYTDTPVAALTYGGQSCYIGFSLNVGVCCAPVVPAGCPTGTQCAPRDYCGPDGHLVSQSYPGPYAPAQECHLNIGTEAHAPGVCCLPPTTSPTSPEVDVCAVGTACTSRSYCDAGGFISPVAVSGAGYQQGQSCYVEGSGEVGVCCTPFPPATCPAGTACTSLDYCSERGYTVPDPHQGPYYPGQECSVNGAYGNSATGVCCKPALPPQEHIPCPQGSDCVPLDFCFGEMLETDQVAYSPFTQQKSWYKCAVPLDVPEGVCCRSAPEPPQETCGVSRYANNDLKTRFYDPKLDKKEADFGEMPWQAIVFYSNYTFKCGASLISDRHLLTVAHCVDGLYPYDLRVRLGEWQVNTFDEPLPYQDFNISKITVHPHWDKKKVWNNLAILEMEYPVNLGYNINNICLPFGEINFSSPTRCIVSGWGKNSFEGNYQHILKKIDLPLVEHDACQAYLRKTRLRKYFKLHESYRCAGGEEGIDACVGDGGGPLICYSEHNKQYVQVGITAWGIGCGSKDVPAAYTDVTKFTPWISEVTGLGASVGGYGK